MVPEAVSVFSLDLANIKSCNYKLQKDTKRARDGLSLLRALVIVTGLQKGSSLKQCSKTNWIWSNKKSLSRETVPPFHKQSSSWLFITLHSFILQWICRLLLSWNLTKECIPSHLIVRVTGWKSHSTLEPFSRKIQIKPLSIHQKSPTQDALPASNEVIQSATGWRFTSPP